MSEESGTIEFEDIESDTAPTETIKAVDPGAPKEVTLADDETANPLDAIERPIDGDTGRVGEDLSTLSNIHTGGSRDDAAAAASLPFVAAPVDTAAEVARAQTADAPQDQGVADTAPAAANSDRAAAQGPAAAAADLTPTTLNVNGEPQAVADPAPAPAAPPTPPVAAPTAMPSPMTPTEPPQAAPSEPASDAATTEPTTAATTTTTTDTTPTDPAETDPTVTAATAPTLATSAVSGDEDTGIALDLSTALSGSTGEITVTISGVPDGATLSAGTRNPDGTWTLTQDQLSGLVVTPPADSDDDFTLTVTATSTSLGGQTASTTSTLQVTVNAVADAPQLTASAAAGNEDTPIGLAIAAALSDKDGSETLSVTITGVPDGASLSAGTANADGSWTLTADQLSGLTLTPGLHSDGDFTLTVTATSREGANGDTATTVVAVPVILTAVADAPTLTASAAAGTEDTAIVLNIAAALVDTDGSESLASITIAGVPEGASLSAGTLNADGSWTLTPAQLSGLTLTPAANSDGDFTLTVTATSVEGSNGSTASTTVTVPVSVNAVADAPTLTASAEAGTEDTPIALNIAAALTDTDGSETLASITIAGVPAGAILSAGTLNGDGSWTLTPGQLSGLTLMPAANSDADFTLTVTATSVESANGSTASTTVTVPVSVNAVADAPTLTASAEAGTEDTAIALNIAGALTDTDMSESLASITISGVPDGASLSAGTLNADGSWTLTPAQLSGLSLTPAANSDADFTLTVTATSVEGANGSAASTTVSVPVSVAAVADAPTLTAAAEAGTEDTAIALDIAAALTDTDGSEALASITIAGVPDGASLSAGTLNGDGSWTLTPEQLPGLSLTPVANSDADFTLTVTATSVEDDNGDTASTTVSVPVSVAAVANAPTLTATAEAGTEDTAIALDIASALTDTDGSESLASITIAGVPDGASLSAGTLNADGSWTLTPAQLSGLSLTPAANSDADFTLTVTATSVESANGSTASTTVSVPVSVNAVADAPTLTAAAEAGTEDTAIALDIAAALTDTDGSETLASITIAGVPDGASLSAGTLNGDGSWTLTPAQLSGLTLTPAVDSDADFTLTVTATSVEDDNGDTASTTVSVPVSVAAVADAPTLTATAEAGTEDTAIALDIASALTDTDSSEALASITIAGVPDGASLSAGILNADGSWTLTPAQLSGLSLTPAANSDADFTLTVTATSVEDDNGDTASTTVSVPVSVEAVADAPTLTASAAPGTEDTAIALDITSALTDTDSSEGLTLTLSGIPDGAVLSAGTLNPDGSWSLTADQIAGLTLTPPQNFSGSIAVEVTATATEAANGDAASVVQTVTVEVSPVADAPDLSVSDITVAESAGHDAQAIALDAITTALTDTDGSETIGAITIAGVPDGWALNHGTSNGDGSWTLSQADLSGLTITPPADYAVNSNEGFAPTLTVTVESGEQADPSQIASTTRSFSITVTPTADTPDAAASDATTAEGAAVKLDLSAAETDLHGPAESLTTTIVGVPEGFELVSSAGDPVGSSGADGWSVPADELNDIYLRPVAGNATTTNFSGTIDLTLMVTATDGASTSAPVAVPFSVTYTAVADAAIVTVSDITVTEAAGHDAQAIALDNIAVAVADADSESIGTITISGVPEGWTLNHGSDTGSGSWTLSEADLSGLTITPPADYAVNSDAGTAPTLSVTVESVDGGQTATTTQSFTITVTPTADTPDVAADDTSGAEGAAVKLDLSALETDLHGPAESLTVTIGGVPDGFELVTAAGAAAGTSGADGWSVAADSLNDVYLRPVAGNTTTQNFSGSIDLTLTATATDGASTSAPVVMPFSVTYTPVADAPIVTVSDITVAEAAGHDAQAIALDNIAAALTDADSEAIGTITIADVPDGWALNHGTSNGDGSWTLSQADLSGLTITPPADYAVNSDGGTAPTLSVTVQSVENADSGQTASTTQSFTITVTPTADTPTATAEDASGAEGAAVKLDLSALETDLHGPAESLTVTIGGVPDGFELVTAAGAAAGSSGADGWSVAADSLNDVYLRPVAGNTTTQNFSGSIDLTLTATSTDGSSTSAPVVMPFSVTYTPEADAPIVTVSDITVAEAAGHDAQAIALDNIAAAVTDADSESIGTITISDVPDGWALNHGTSNGDGSWTLSQADLSGLTITPPADYAVNSDGGTAPTLSVTVESVENADSGQTASTTQSFSITVTPTADTPDATAEDGSGAEGAAVKLDLSAAETDLHGPAEALAVTIGGVPSGFELVTAAGASAGSHSGTTWTVSADSLDNVYLRPVTGNTTTQNFSGDIALTLAVTSTDGSSTSAPTTVPFTVTYTPVADAPTVTVSNVTVAEAAGHGAQAISLNNITTALTDTDGSEAISSVTIGGVPDGWALNHGSSNGDGSWTLSQADLSGLTITPPADYAVNSDGGTAPTLTVTVESVENADASQTASTTRSFSITVTPTADTPDATAEDASGAEGATVKLDLSAAATDLHGPAEALAVTIGGVPSGFELVTAAGASAGSHSGTTWTVSADSLDNVYLRPVAGSTAENFSGDIALTLAVTSTDGSSTSAPTTVPFTVTYTPVVDDPTLSVSDMVVNEASGHGTQTFALTNITTGLIDSDGSEQVAMVTIDGVPDGWTLNHGTNNGDGNWSLSQSQLSGLTISAPGDYSVLSETGDALPTLTVTVLTEEKADPGTYGSASGSFTITVNPTSDAADTTVRNVSGVEGVATKLDLSALQTDTDGPEESLSLRVLDVPTLFELVDSSGTVVGSSDGHGNWTVTGVDLDNLYLSPIDTKLAEDYSGTVNLRFETTSTDGTATGATVTKAFTVALTGDADTPTLTASATNGIEDGTATTGATTLNLTGLTTDVDGSESLAYSLNFGTAMAAGKVWYNSGTGWKSETVGADGTVTLSASNIAGGLKFQGPTNWSGESTVTVTATATDYGGDTASTAQTLTFAVTAVADKATLTGTSASAVGTERETESDPGAAFSVKIKLADTDGSESIQSITITGVPDGWSLNKGTENADGSYSFTTADVNSSGYITGLQLVSPIDYSDVDGSAVKLTLAVVTSEASNGATTTSTKTIAVSITPEADTPELTAENVIGDEGTAIKLDVGVTETDEYVSAKSVDETLTVEITGVPGNFELVDANGDVVGERGEDGTWSVITGKPAGVEATLNDLYIRPVAGNALAEDFGDGNIELAVHVTSTDGSVISDVVEQAFTVHYVGVADTPELTVRATSGDEDTAIALDIRPVETDADGSELISVRIDDIPVGAILSVAGIAVFAAGTGTTSFTLSQDQLADLTITPPTDSNQDFTLRVTAISTEAGSGDATESVPQTLAVTVRGVADTPEVVSPLASGTEDQAGGIPLNLDSVVVLGDDDSANSVQSEVMTAVISGLPPGFTLTEGELNADGSWSLTSDQLSTVKLVAPGDYSGTIELTVKAIATERYEDGDSQGTGAVSTKTFTLDVDITPVVDDDNGFHGTTGDEDSFISLDVAPITGDSDHSETWTSVTLADIPAGATLRYTGADGSVVEQEFAAGGSITLTHAQAADLAIRPPVDSNDDFDLSLTATIVDSATDHNGNIMTSSRETTGTLHVNVVGVADADAVVAADDASASSRTMPLDIAGQSGDIDTSEGLYYIVSDMPQGAMLNHGFNNGDGTWTVMADDLSGLNITLPSGTASLNLQVQLVAAENDGDTNLDEVPVVDSFTVSVVSDGGGSGGDGGSGSGGGGDTGGGSGSAAIGSVSGVEDSAIAIGGQLATAFSGIDTASVTLGGIPAGAVIDGTYTDNGDGTITVLKADLAGLTVTPPAHNATDFTLSVDWNASGVDQSGSLGVAVTPEADAPIVVVSDSGAVEDMAVTVTISLSEVDRDGSESKFLVIDQLPDGASLVGGIQNANGSWTIPVDRESSDETVTITIMPPANFSGAMPITVAGVSMEEETGEYVRNDATVTITVEPRADAATISANLPGGGVDEDTAMPLNLSIGVTDAGETVAAVVVQSLPDGFVLTDGTTDATGHYIAVGTATADGWDVTGLDYGSLMVVPRDNYSGTVSVTVAVTTADGADTQTNSQSIGLTFNAITDQAVVTTVNGAGTEDGAVTLDLTALKVDADGSEIMSVTISGLPDGGMLSAGVNNGDGSWTLSSGQLTGVQFLPPENLSGSVTLTLTATTMEKATGAIASTSQNFDVTLTPVADTPDLDVTVLSVSTAEDSAVALSLSAALFDSSETLTVVFSNVPGGGSFSKGAAGAVAGTWEIQVSSPADLADLTFTPPANADTGSGAYDLTVTALATESDGSSASSGSEHIAVTVSSVIDAAALSIADITVAEAEGHVAQEIALDITPHLVDSDGSEALGTVIIEGVPDGWVLNHGTDNGNGSWTLSQADLTGLSITTPTDYAVNSGAAPELKVTVETFETADPASATTVSDSFTITVTPTADTPDVMANDVATEEGETVQLDLSAVQTDENGPAETLTVTLLGVPEGFELVNSNGDTVGTTDAGGWTLPADSLADVYLRPEPGNITAENASGSFDLTLQVTAQDGDSTSAPTETPFTVTYAPVADTPDLSGTVTTISGTAGEEIALTLSATSPDPDEALSIDLTVPDNAVLSAGAQNGNEWTLTPDDLTGLTLTMPTDAVAGEYSIDMSVTAYDGGSTASAGETVAMTLDEWLDATRTADSGGGDSTGGGDYTDPNLFSDSLGGDLGGGAGSDPAPDDSSGLMADAFSMGDGIDPNDNYDNNPIPAVA